MAIGRPVPSIFSLSHSHSLSLSLSLYIKYKIAELTDSTQLPLWFVYIYIYILYLYIYICKRGNERETIFPFILNYLRTINSNEEKRANQIYIYIYTGAYNMCMCMCVVCLRVLIYVFTYAQNANIFDKGWGRLKGDVTSLRSSPLFFGRLDYWRNTIESVSTRFDAPLSFTGEKAVSAVATSRCARDNKKKKNRRVLLD